MHHHAAVLGMKQLHQLAALTDEDEHVAIPDLTLHPLMYHPAQRADALAHICPSRAQVVPHRVVKAEHDQRDSWLIIP